MAAAAYNLLQCARNRYKHRNQQNTIHIIPKCIRRNVDTLRWTVLLLFASFASRQSRLLLMNCRDSPSNPGKSRLSEVSVPYLYLGMLVGNVVVNKSSDHLRSNQQMIFLVRLKKQIICLPSKTCYFQIDVNSFFQLNIFGIVFQIYLIENRKSYFNCIENNIKGDNKSKGFLLIFYLVVIIWRTRIDNKLFSFEKKIIPKMCFQFGYIAFFTYIYRTRKF